MEHDDSAGPVKARNVLNTQAKPQQTLSDRKMERETGIEPVTSSLGSWRSTAELLPLQTSRCKR